MRKLDLLWMEYSHFDDDLNCVLNDDAPEEAVQSYEHYLEQSKRVEEEISAGISMD